MKYLYKLSQKAWTGTFKYHADGALLCCFLLELIHVCFKKYRLYLKKDVALTYTYLPFCIYSQCILQYKIVEP